MLKPKLSNGAGLLLGIFLQTNIFLSFSLVNGKVENSFQSNQYSPYNNYYSSTPSTYPDLTVKTADSSSSVGSDSHQDPLLGQGTAQQPLGHGALNQHVYYYETYPMHDGSRGNPYIPAGNKRCKTMANGHTMCYSRQDVYGASDYDTTGADGDSGGSGLGGLAGLIGLLGLKGLKGLASVIFPAIIPLLFPLLIPLALPIILPLLLLLLVPILFIPIPVISVPAPTVRFLKSGVSEARKMASDVFDQVLLSDECVERISCEISKINQRGKTGEWMQKAIRLLPESSSITKRIVKGFSMINANSTTEAGATTKQHSLCSKLKCKILSMFDSTPA